MVLVFIPFACTWAFLFPVDGKDRSRMQYIPIMGQRFFTTRKEAIHAIRKIGMDVDRRNRVHITGPNPYTER